jgi:hypothetical protein
MKTSARQKSFTFTRNASAIFGKDSLKRSPLKKNPRTSSQPGEFTTTRATATRKTIVLPTAIATVRVSPDMPARILERRSTDAASGG